MNYSQTKEEHVSVCRLGPFVTAEKLLLSAKPGDLIEIDRTIYVHWALYLGKGEVAHVACEHLNEHTTEALVVRSKVLEVCGKSLVRVNNKQVPAKKRGLVGYKWKRIAQNVNKIIGQHVHYNILTQNAEHWVTEWKYGTGWSDQARAAMESMTILSSSPTTARELQKAHSTLTRNIKTLLQRQSPT